MSPYVRQNFLTYSAATMDFSPVVTVKCFITWQERAIPYYWSMALMQVLPILNGKIIFWNCPNISQSTLLTCLASANQKNCLFSTRRQFILMSSKNLFDMSSSSRFLLSPADYLLPIVATLRIPILNQSVHLP